MVLPVRPSLFVLLRSLVLGGICGAVVLACGDGSTGSDPVPTGDGGRIDGGGPTKDSGRLPAPLRPPASCEVIIDTPELLASPHVTEGSQNTYNSNPPSSGPHYPQWANFQEFSAPLEEGYLVHSLEHGAVALLYKCEGAACAPTIEALKKIRDSLPNDPLCDATIRVRVIIAPYPKLDVPVAAVAWGWTYKAQCVDVPTLTQFAKDRAAQGPENICAAGRTF
jgi:hypothetical protein